MDNEIIGTIVLIALFVGYVIALSVIFSTARDAIKGD